MTITGFDPYGVPAHPVVTIDIHVDANGAEHALVDAAPVSPRAGESPRTAALRVAAELVGRLTGDQRPEAAGVRVRLNGPDVRGYEAVIDRHGRLFVPVGSATLARQPEPGSLVAVAQKAFDRSSVAGIGNRTEARSGVAGMFAAIPTSSQWSPTFIDEVPEPDETPKRDEVPELDETPKPDEALEPIDEPVAGPPASTPPSSASAAGSSADRLVTLLRPGVKPPDAVLVPAESETPGETDAPEAAPRRRTLRGVVIVIAVAAMLAAGGIVSIVIGLMSPGADKPSAESPGAGEGSTAPQSPRPFPGTPPAGFSSKARWISEPVETGRVTAWDDTVAYLTASRRLVVVDAMTGAARWSASLARSGEMSAPARTRIDGEEVLATQVGSVLSWWRLRDGHSLGRLDLPSGAHTTFLGEAPLVGVDQHTVAIINEGRLREIAVPGGAYALAATTQGRVTAASSRGWWHLRPGMAPGLVQPWEDAAPDEQAPQAAPSVVGYANSSVLLLYPADRTGQLHVVAHTDRAEDIRASFRGRVAAVEGVTQHWWPSPTQTWGVLGRTVVDLRRGRVSDLGDWTTTWITQDQAYGTVAGQAIQTDAAGNRGTTPAGSTIPDVVTGAGAVVRAGRSQAEALYLLPPG